MDQNDTIERLEIKLKYDVKNRNQLYNLPFFFLFLRFENH